jgi:hypothetical protein
MERIGISDGHRSLVVRNIQAGGKRDATGITGAGREYPRTCHDKKDPRHETSFQDCTSPMFASRKIAGSRLCTLIES